MALVKKEGPKEEKSRRDWLKAKHKDGHQQRMVDCGARGRRRWGGRHAASVLEGGGPLCGGKYAGPKEKLQPIYEDLLRLGESLDDDAKACPCKTIVPPYREHVFAQIKPTTNSRIDLGLALTHYKGKLPKRIIDTGGLAKKDRITHRIELKSTDQIVSEVKKWLKTACDLDA